MEMESNMFNRLLLWARPDIQKTDQGQFKILHAVRDSKTRAQVDKKNVRETGPSSNIED